ncbi:MAG: hypothetical protein HYX24_06430 [Candidatus Aenigmarchaeota archaeon]|nr:hypothetical protein [Candidatus Aenigmarchaeota archaeon]
MHPKMSRFGDAKAEIKKASSLPGTEFLEKAYSILYSRCKYTGFGLFGENNQKIAFGNIGTDSEKAIEKAKASGKISTSGKAISSSIGNNGNVTAYLAIESFLPFFDDLDRNMAEFLAKILEEKAGELL